MDDSLVERWEYWKGGRSAEAMVYDTAALLDIQMVRESVEMLVYMMDIEKVFPTVVQLVASMV